MADAVEGFRHPFDPSVWPSPYAAYRWLAEHDPLHRDAFSRMTFVVRHADCDALLRDRSASAAQAQQQRARGEPLPRTMLNTDPPEHDVLRAPAMRLLGPQIADALRPKFDAQVDELLDGLAERDTVDAMADIANPFVTAVLALLLDLPRDVWPAFSRLARASSINLDPTATPDRIALAGEATARLSGLLREHAGRASAQLQPLDEAERTATLMLIVVGGYEPLVNLAVTGLNLLARTPGLASKITPDTAIAYVDEVLRLESPIPFVARTTTDDLAVPGGELAADTVALALLGAANRDPDVFPDPDELRLDRPANAHLGFGAGVHYCPGAPLVRIAGAALFSQIAQRFPDLAPTDPHARPRWRRSLVPRGLAALPLRLIADVVPA